MPQSLRRALVPLGGVVVMVVVVVVVGQSLSQHTVGSTRWVPEMIAAFDLQLQMYQLTITNISIFIKR